MPRYFIEVAYKGTNYAGFQIQQNANSIQAEIEKALKIFYRQEFKLTGSSRTDAGVHALQNFFHVDTNFFSEHEAINNNIYNLNAILPDDIVIKKMYQVADNAHCRFDALSREYKYYTYQNKDPFIADSSFYYPYRLDLEKLQQAATVLLDYNDFTTFSKKNTQVKTFICELIKSQWMFDEDQFCYNVIGNRFLRGMVRGLVGTMLNVGTNKLSVDGFRKIIEAKDCTLADFSVPAHALFLVNVKY
ncbi:tRNA pseudouridine(38-40) synthase TruA [Ferruginibacter sp. SUN002]|uniref:tRNA pseudouridine(38-40) synthase TruA n=1 Tax=Ferruginibacter sp. SUN002 TaxID=2937789 RepID=UPI003D366E21